MPGTTNESRRYPRIRVHLPVQLSMIDPDREAWAGEPDSAGPSATGTNLSRGGIFIVTDRPVAPGHQLRIELTLPDGRRPLVSGRVAWSKITLAPSALSSPGGKLAESGIGLEFSEAAPAEGLAAIADYVARQIRRERRRIERIVPQLSRGIQRIA